MLYKLMRYYWDEKRREFILDVYNTVYKRGVELHYYRREWTLGKIQRMKNSLNQFVSFGDLKTLNEWDKVFTDFEGVI